MKKISDEARVGIICFIWEISFCIACLTNKPFVWLFFAFVTAVEIIIIYFDNKIEQAQEEAKRNRNLFSKQTQNYLATICEYSREEKSNDER